MGAALCCCAPSRNDVGPTDDVIVPRSPPFTAEQCRGNLLVFVNPHSGRGKSLQTFVRQVAPQLDKNCIKYELIVTAYREHAKSVLMTKTDLASFNGLLILSGDGLVFEALNGILLRDDAFRILPTLPIGIVPSGSGNGLLCSVLAKHGESLKPKNVMSRAIELATSWHARAEPVALYRVQTDVGEYAAFLSIGWGLMADIDIESEKWRNTLGSQRFTLGGLIRSFNLRTYRGRLAYKPYADRSSKVGERFEVYRETTQKRIESLEAETGSSPHSQVPVSPALSSKWVHYDEQNEESGWVTIEDEFISVYAVTLSHISADGPFAPTAQLDDSRIHLTWILKKDIRSRMDVVKYLTGIEEKKHLDLPFVNYVEVSSLRLDAISEGSYIVLDGEVVDTRGVVVHSTQHNMSIFSPGRT